MKETNKVAIRAWLDGLRPAVIGQRPTDEELENPDSIFTGRLKNLRANVLGTMIGVFVVSAVFFFLADLRPMSSLRITDYFPNFFREVSCVQRSFDLGWSAAGSWQGISNFVLLAFWVNTTLTLFAHLSAQARWLFVRYFVFQDGTSPIRVFFVTVLNTAKLLFGLACISLPAVGAFLLYPEFNTFLCKKFVNASYGALGYSSLTLANYFFLLSISGFLFFGISTVLSLICRFKYRELSE